MKLDSLLQSFKNGDINQQEVIASIRASHTDEMKDLVIDLQRESRCGFPEVIYGKSKTCEQIFDASRAVLKNSSRLLVTRVNKEKSLELMPKLEPLGCLYKESSQLIYKIDEEQAQAGKVLVLGAGTSDLSVAEEAAVTCRLFGAQVDMKIDVGVAGIHRLLELGQDLQDADCIIVCAGMEGALPSVVGGLVSAPVIAVPVSSGYGTAFGGVTALLGMLNSCASGLTVVNIDNGFGAGFAAGRLINTLNKKNS